GGAVRHAGEDRLRPGASGKRLRRRRARDDPGNAARCAQGVREQRPRGFGPRRRGPRAPGQLRAARTDCLRAQDGHGLGTRPVLRASVIMTMTSPDRQRLVLTHSSLDRPGLLESWATATGYRLDLHRADTEPSLPGPGGYAAVIVLGSVESVNNDAVAWIGRERRVVEAAIGHD